MTRRQIRECVFLMIFRVEFHEREELPEQMQYLEQTLDSLEEQNEELSAEAAKLRDKDKRYIEDKSADIIAHLDELDEAINAQSLGWKTGRMSKVDLSIIRLAVYEIRYEEAVPLKVSINEAVELAKKYGTNDSASFVNGILAKFAQEGTNGGN